MPHDEGLIPVRAVMGYNGDNLRPRSTRSRRSLKQHLTNVALVDVLVKGILFSSKAKCWPNRT